MISPTIAADGHTYEHAAIRVWLQHHARPDRTITEPEPHLLDLTLRTLSRSPLTNEPLANLDLYPNHLLRSEIYHLFESHEELAKAARFYERLRDEAVFSIGVLGLILRLGLGGFGRRMGLRVVPCMLHGIPC